MIQFIIVKYNTEIVYVLFKCVFVRKRINIFKVFTVYGFHENIRFIQKNLLNFVFSNSNVTDSPDISLRNRNDDYYL